MSFGDDIRRERELRQISLGDVAQATKINIRYLEAMERNEFLHLPGGVFNRGFVRAYCEFIGVDSEGMVNAYLVEERTQAARNRVTIPNVAREPDAPRASQASGGRSRVLLLGGLALLVVVAIAVSLSVWYLGKPAGFGGAAGSNSPAPKNTASGTDQP